MEITGRLTADAEVKKTKNSKEVVSFCIAVNDTYKTKDGEKKEFVEFFNCSYWLGTKVADALLKGAIVTVSGRIYLNEYAGKDGNKYASLCFHANAIKVFAASKKNGATSKAEQVAAASTETVDDLPF